jgi:CHAT domain-containing protein
MIDFHKALIAMNRNSDHVRGSAEALRAAALKMLRTPGYSHPIYWAPFIVIGDGR